MKGLIVKDLELMKANIRVFSVVYVIGVLLLMTSGGDTTFFVMYISTISGIVSLNTMSFDITDHGLTYLMTLPVTRKQYVVEKYLFSFLFGTLAWLLAMAVGTIVEFTTNGGAEIAAWFVECIPGLFICNVFAAICIPIELKFRQENVRLIIMGIWFSIFIVWYILENGMKIFFGKSVTEEAGRLLNANPALAAGIVIAAVIGVIAASVLISCHVMEHKEL